MENTNLWNTKVNDLTVGDTVKMSVVTPVITVGATVVAGALFAGLGAIYGKLRNRTPKTETTESE